MGAVEAGLGFYPQLLLQRADESVEKVMAARFRFEHLFPYQRVDDGVKQDGAHPGLAELFIDPHPHLTGFFLGLHKGDSDLLEGQRKLAQYRVAEHFGGDGGAV